MSWLMPDIDEEQRILEDRRSAAEFGQKFVWCVEHERLVSKCRQLASENYGLPAFDNCQWITEAEAGPLCDVCGSVGVTSCQSFPCEHGGHTCTACGGSGRLL